MDTYQLFASLVGSLAWPSATVGVAVLLRTAIVDLLSRLRTVKGAGVEVTIGTRADEVREMIEINSRRADGDPTSSSLALPTSSEQAVAAPLMLSDQGSLRTANRLFDQLVKSAPGGAILAAWTPVREALERAADRAGVPHIGCGSTQIASHLVDSGHIEIHLADAVASLRTLREEASRRADSASPVDAFQFRDAALETASAIYTRMARVHQEVVPQK